LLVDRGVLDGVFGLLKIFHFFEIYFSGREIKRHTPGAKAPKIQVNRETQG
jgi:hypothetical protein